MAYPRKKERNEKLVKTRDEIGLSFSELGRAFGVARHTAIEIYWREKRRANKAQNELSTAK